MVITKAQQAYEEIEQLIVKGGLQAGSLVSEATLMELTGLGRTPVREALQLLARNRMVEIFPSKGILVPSISAESQLRMLELRRVLEVMAVQHAAERAPSPIVERMKAMEEKLQRETFTLDSYLDTIKETHLLIVQGSCNPYLADAIAPVQGLSRRFWYSHVRDEETEIRRGSTLHQGILRAVTARDAGATEAASLKLNDYLVDFTQHSLLSPGRFTGRS